MKRIILTSSLIIMILLCLVSMSSCSKKDQTLNTYTVEEGFSNISINVSESNIVFLPSDDGKCRVESQEYNKLKHSVTVVGDTLKIEEDDSRRFYEKFFGSGSFSATVYLPLGTYKSLVINGSTGDISIDGGFSFETINIDASTGNVSCSASASSEMKITLSTGDITVSDFNGGSVCLEVSTGKINASNISCSNFRSNGTTGSATLNGVVATESINVSSTTGDVSLNSCDGAEIFIGCTTGDVNCSLLTDKIVYANATTGNINVPKCYEGGKCEIETTTGNINVSIEGK